jgi:hypothetical protein
MYGAGELEEMEEE